MTKHNSPQHTPSEDDILRRMLNTPPKPHEVGKTRPKSPEEGQPKRPGRSKDETGH